MYRLTSDKSQFLSSVTNDFSYSSYTVQYGVTHGYDRIISRYHMILKLVNGNSNHVSFREKESRIQNDVPVQQPVRSVCGLSCQFRGREFDSSLLFQFYVTTVAKLLTSVYVTQQ